MKKLNKRWLAVIPAAAAGLLLAACGNSSSSTSSKKQTLNWMASTEVQTLDVSKVTDATSAD